MTLVLTISVADPRFYNPEEQVQKYSLVITCSLDGWAYLLGKVDDITNNFILIL
jgi:hypothetical protein